MIAPLFDLLGDSHAIDALDQLKKMYGVAAFVGLEMPDVYKGVKQYPLSGKSMAYTFDAKPDDL